MEYEMRLLNISSFYNFIFSLKNMKKLHPDHSILICIELICGSISYKLMTIMNIQVSILIS